MFKISIQGEYSKWVFYMRTFEPIKLKLFIYWILHHISIQYKFSRRVFKKSIQYENSTCILSSILHDINVQYKSLRRVFKKSIQDENSTGVFSNKIIKIICLVCKARVEYSYRILLLKTHLEYSYCIFVTFFC